jgi:hypothetical protein
MTRYRLKLKRRRAVVRTAKAQRKFDEAQHAYRR